MIPAMTTGTRHYRNSRSAGHTHAEAFMTASTHLHDQVRPECPHAGDADAGFRGAVRRAHACQPRYPVSCLPACHRFECGGGWSLGSGGRGRPYSQRSWRRQCRPTGQEGLLATGIDDARLSAGAERRWRGTPSRPGDDRATLPTNGALTIPMKGANLGLNSDSAILVDSGEIRFCEGIIRKPRRNGVDAQRRQGLGDCCRSQWRAAKPTVVSGIDARQTRQHARPSRWGACDACQELPCQRQSQPTAGSEWSRESTRAARGNTTSAASSSGMDPARACLFPDGECGRQVLCRILRVSACACVFLVYLAVQHP